MATVTKTPNASIVKLKFACGHDINGKEKIKYKSLTNMKDTATNEDVMAVVNAIAELQENDLAAINRIDNSSLEENL